MREKPIIFSTEMVKAILAGRKTQTRRVIKPQPRVQLVQKEQGSRWSEYSPGIDEVTGSDYGYGFICPWQVGDILWVRETWRIGAWDENTASIAVDYKADNFARREWLQIEDEKTFEKYWIQSTDDAGKAGLLLDAEGQYHWKVGEAPTRWRPSLFMPRAAARIILRVTNVRVERLQEITEEDAIAEGFINDVQVVWNNYSPDYTGMYARERFSQLWDKLNAKRGYGWDTNPFVWVIKFERTEVPK